MENHHRHHHAAATNDSSSMIELLDLDAEVLHAYGSEVMDGIQALAPDPRRILDLGSGSGTGTLALAQRFPAADVTALDVSTEFLDHLRDRAQVLGVGDRVHPLAVDLDTTWPALEAADLVWASMSMHHLADPGRVLADVLGTLRPGGLLVVAEMESFPRFLPDDIGVGRPGLEDRCHAVLDSGFAHEMPHRGADWGPHLSAAGFTVEAQRRFDLHLTPPLPAATARYAEATLRRMRTGLDGRIDADDLAALDTLITSDGPDGIGQRQDLSVRAVRTVWTGRRP